MMMKISFIKLFIIALFLSSCGSEKTTPVTNLADQEKEVAIAVEKFKTGIIDADRALLEDLFADNLIYGHSGEMFRTKLNALKR